MTTGLWFLVLDVANLTCIALLGARVLLAIPRQRNAQLVGLLCFCSFCHFFLSRSDYRFWIQPAYQFHVGDWRPLLNVMRNLTPGLLMILVHQLFTDGRGLPRWLWAAFALQIFFEEPIKWLVPAGALPPLMAQLVPTLLQTLFAGLALYWTLADWRLDLIEARRRGRVLLMAILLVNVVASSLLLRVVIPQDSPANYQTQLVLTACNLAILAFLLLRFAGDDIARFLDPARPRPSALPVAAPDNSAALARLTGLMQTEQLYRQPGLSLKALADRAQLPEYRLRRLIHEELGYRNFNAYLHDYRIKDACAQLLDPALRRTPIITIALTVGYQSLNTFNRGFRETVGDTPSAYRAGAEKPDQILQSDPNFANRPGLPQIGEP